MSSTRPRKGPKRLRVPFLVTVAAASGCTPSTPPTMNPPFQEIHGNPPMIVVDAGTPSTPTANVAGPAPTAHVAGPTPTPMASNAPVGADEPEIENINGVCYVIPAPLHCPPPMHCNPPPRRKVPCPKP